MGRGRVGSGDWGHAGPPPQIVYKIGIYGWRKRCLYIFILLIMVIVMVNFALTIWILRVLDFTTDGMGKLRISHDRIRVEGDSEFLKQLYASHIESRETSPLYIQSAANISLTCRGNDQRLTNKLFMGDHKVEAHASRFDIRTPDGQKLLFSANDREVFIGAEKLSVSGSTGASFTGSVQTPLIRPQSSESLRLESPTKTLYVTAPSGVHLKAPVGSISLNSLIDVKIQSRKKAIHLDATNITLKNLLISQPGFDGRPYPEVYQLCICGRNGKLFLAPARGNCQATTAVCD